MGRPAYSAGGRPRTNGHKVQAIAIAARQTNDTVEVSIDVSDGPGSCAIGVTVGGLEKTNSCLKEK